MARPPKHPGLVTSKILPVRLTDDEFAGVAELVRRQRAALHSTGAAVTAGSFVRGLVRRELAAHNLDVATPAPLPPRQTTLPGFEFPAPPSPTPAGPAPADPPVQVPPTPPAASAPRSPPVPADRGRALPPSSERPKVAKPAKRAPPKPALVKPSPSPKAKPKPTPKTSGSKRKASHR